MLMLMLFNKTIFTQLLWMLGTNLPPKTDIFVARLDPTTKWLIDFNTVITCNLLIKKKNLALLSASVKRFGVYCKQGF